MTEQGRTQADIIDRLLNKIEEQQKTIRELENRIGKQQAEANPEPTGEEKEDKEAFFQVIKPSVVGASERKNAIVEWFKEQDKFHTAIIPDITEEVFGHRTENSSHDDYRAVVNVITEAPEIIPGEGREGRYQEYKLSNKVSRE